MNHPANPAPQDAPLDPRDIGTRLDELRLLEDGWLDSSTKALSPEGLDWLEEAFRLHYTGKAPPPYIYPASIGGGVSVEWRIGPFYISLDIDLATKLGEWHSMNMETDEDEEEDINLTDEESWQWLVDALREKMKDAA